MVGSAWTGRDTRSSVSEGVVLSVSPVVSEEGSEAWILEMARHQRMNTDLRKTLFGVIMTAEVYCHKCHYRTKYVVVLNM